MEFRFVPPDLRRLDETSAEVLACAIWADELPMRGLAGLLDFRLAGRLSRLQRQGFLHGALGEVLCVPVRPRLPFDKLLLFGLGPRASFDEAVFEDVALHLLRALEGLHVRRAVVELPGARAGVVPADRATQIVLDAVGESEAHDAWWLVADAEAERKVTQRADDPRRVRRA